MGTRSNIYLKLDNKSCGKANKFHITKLGGSYRKNKSMLLYPIEDVAIPVNARYMHVYHQFDGHIYSLGKELAKNYNTYDKVLNLLTMGDFQTIMFGYKKGKTCVESRQGTHGMCTPPKFLYDETKFRVGKRDEKGHLYYENVPFLENGELPANHAIREAYAYYFDGEKWFVSWYESVKGGSSVFHDWVELKSAIKKYRKQ